MLALDSYLSFDDALMVMAVGCNLLSDPRTTYKVF